MSGLDASNALDIKTVTLRSENCSDHDGFLRVLQRDAGIVWQWSMNKRDRQEGMFVVSMDCRRQDF